MSSENGEIPQQFSRAVIIINEASSSPSPPMLSSLEGRETSTLMKIAFTNFNIVGKTVVNTTEMMGNVWRELHKVHCPF